MTGRCVGWGLRNFYGIKKGILTTHKNMKVCIKCNQEKEEKLYWRGKNICKLCKRLGSQKYRLENKEKIKEYHRKHYLQNREKIKKYQRKHYLQNREKTKEYQRKYRLQNIEKIKEYQRKHRLQNIEKAKEYRQKYYLQNREKIIKRKLNDDLKAREQITDGYIKNIINRGMNLLRREDIPNEIIELYRLNLTLKRLKKERVVS